MNIKTVKLKPEGYLVNGEVFVPTVVGNRHYRLVQKWLEEGNDPEPELTSNELVRANKAKAKEKVLEILVEPRPGVEVFGNREAQADLVAILAVLGEGESIFWPRADGEIDTFTKEELSTALNLAVREMVTLITT